MSGSLNAKNKPGWSLSGFFGKLNPFRTRIEPEVYSQSQGITMSAYGLIRPVTTKAGRRQFGEIGDNGNQFIIERPGAGVPIEPERALANNKGFVYAAVNAKAREVMTIDWRLFKATGDEHEEETEHELLDLLDSVNDNMTGLEFKYLTSACLDLTGNAFIYLQGVKNDLDKPKALHLMPPDRVKLVIDKRNWPYQLMGYKMKLENVELAFKPYEVVHLRLPNPANFFQGMSPTAGAAEFIDNDNYAMEFNRKF